MPRIVREAEIRWEGNLARGAGALTAASSGAFSGLRFSSATRTGAPEGETSPEELLAAAHGGCFAMSLAAELARAGTPPQQLEVRCVVTMDEVPGKGHQIVHSEIHAVAVAPGCDAEGLAQAAESADAGCPFSALVRASASVTVTAELG